MFTKDKKIENLCEWMKFIACLFIMKNIAVYYRYITVGNKIAVAIFFFFNIIYWEIKLYKIKLINNVDMIIYSNWVNIMIYMNMWQNHPLI